MNFNLEIGKTRILGYNVIRNGDIGGIMSDDFSFEIVKSCGLISTGKGGWTTELNLVSWGGRPAKYDIRSWSPDHQKMGKGVTLTTEDLVSLKKLLSTLEIQE